MRCTYKYEFPHFDYDIPQLPEGFVDVSWHNNVSPSFEKKLTDDHSITLWVDYADENRRECGGSQFLVMVHVTEELENVLYESDFDSWDDAIKAINDILANEVQQ
jgi:hypothetical protein